MSAGVWINVPRSFGASGIAKPRVAWLASVALIVGLALAFRLYGLDRKSVWFDEALGVEASLLELPDLISTVGAERNPPLYFLLQHFWLGLHSGDWWLRLSSAMAGAAAVGVGMAFARTVVGTVAAIGVGVLLAISPMLVDLSQEARPYGLFMLLAAASLLCLSRATQTNNRFWWIAYSLTAVLTLYTHNYAVFLTAAETIFLMWWLIEKRPISIWAIGAQLIALAAFLPWVVHLAGQLQLVQTGFWIGAPDERVFWDTYQGFLVYSPIDHGLGTNALLKILRWLVLGVLVLSITLTRHNSSARLAALGLYLPVLLAIAFSALVVPIYVMRYVSFAAVPFWILVVGGVRAIPNRVGQGVLGAAILTGVAINLPALYTDPYYSRGDLRSAASYIQEHWQTGDVIVHTRDFSAVPFAYYDGYRQPELLLPDADHDEIQQAVIGYRRVWLVRDFGLLNPAENEEATRETLDALAGFQLEQQVEFQGVHLLVAAIPQP